MISSKRYSLTAEGKAVESDHPDAQRLLVGKGCFIHDEIARRHGILPPPPPGPKAEDKADDKAVPAAPEDKAVRAPKETK